MNISYPLVFLFLWLPKNCISIDKNKAAGEREGARPASRYNNPPQKSLNYQAFWAKQRFEFIKTLGGRSLSRSPRRGPLDKLSRSVSRVLLKTTIYLDLPLPAGSSHLLRTAGPAMRSPTVLLRIEFTASTCLHATSELLPHFSTLTGRQASRRYISVALVRGSPLAGVTRYPCPVEPGLSSRTGFRLVPAVVQPTHGLILIISAPQVNNISCNQPEKAI